MYNCWKKQKNWRYYLFLFEQKSISIFMRNCGKKLEVFLISFYLNQYRSLCVTVGKNWMFPLSLSIWINNEKRKKSDDLKDDFIEGGRSVVVVGSNCFKSPFRSCPIGRPIGRDPDDPGDRGKLHSLRNRSSRCLIADLLLFFLPPLSPSPPWRSLHACWLFKGIGCNLLLRCWALARVKVFV